MEYQKLVKEHYKKEAKENNLSLTSTMADVSTRRLEIENILLYLKPGKKCLEVGCGNGAASIEISKKIKLDLTATDFSSDMIALAKKQSTKGIKGKIVFKEEDVLKINYDKEFDVVFTERCIINLLNWEDQKMALKNMATALKKGGILFLVEAFQDGLDELNNARKDLGLDQIGPAYHNFYLNKEKVIEYLKGEQLHIAQENNFLSSYFFGSRVLYPALAKLAQKEITYNSAFARYFSLLPSLGNYSQIKILAFKKK